MKSLRIASILLLSCPAWAQAPAFDSPGMVRYPNMGQVNRFSTDFNPALGFVLDGFADYIDPDDGDNGYDMDLRLLEFNASSFVDPDAWAYVVISSESLEGLEIEEAAIQYIGFEGASTLKAGRFFVDFGKQMLNHLEQLRTLERPLVLREYLGEELSGTGIQYDNWFPIGDSTPVRFSIGAYSSLLGEGHHGEEEEGEEPEGVIPDRRDIDELSFAARLTGMTDVGDAGQFQLGASARIVPEFSFEDEGSGLEASGLSNTVYGLDATYGWQDDTGNRQLALGVEWLTIDGDLSAELDTSGATPTLDVVDDSANGFYGFVDYRWSPQSSAGLQYSWAEMVEDADSDESELDLYYTRNLTEFRRLRLGLTWSDSDLDDEALRVYLQFTAFFGSHSHGLNW